MNDHKKNIKLLKLSCLQCCLLCLRVWQWCRRNVKARHVTGCGWPISSCWRYVGLGLYTGTVSRNSDTTVNSKWWSWNKLVAARLVLMTLKITRLTEENHVQNPRDGLLVSRFETSISQIRVRSANLSNTNLVVQYSKTSSYCNVSKESLELRWVT